MFWVLAAVALTACNSNDDGVDSGIEIPGINLTEDVECCTAEDALHVYKFLQTVKVVPGLTKEVDGKYNVFAYTRDGSFHNGYNEIFFVATKRLTGNYVKDLEVKNISPLMHMVKMDMYHSTPTGPAAERFSEDVIAVKRSWVSFLMNTSEAGTWAFSYDIAVLGSKASVTDKAIVVNAIPDGQEWLKNFKVGDNTYYLSLVNPIDWKTGENVIQAYISKKSAPITTPYALASETFTVEIDPRMPDMGSHTSPGNKALTKQADGSYKGSINLTMTGLWRIHLTVKDAQGNIVAGGDDQKDGFSSLYWDVTL